MHATFKTLTEKRTLGRSRRTWKDSIRVDLKDMGFDMRYWTDSCQDKNY